MNFSHVVRVFLLSVFLIQCTLNLCAQHSFQEITVKNHSTNHIFDYMLEIPLAKLKLSIGNYVVVIGKDTIPAEISTDIQGHKYLIILIPDIKPTQEIELSIIQGDSENYPKRTYAELSHKIGGEFVGHQYKGGYSWVKPNRISLPGSFRDHSYYIKYEGPGWENDKAAFRFYLDNRNAIDVFGKKTSEISLPAVGVDGFDNYHVMAEWGMDNMKVGNSLGIGSIAIWDGTKAVRVEKKDSVLCQVVADGKLRSQVKTNYYGWIANDVKCNLTSLISIDAGVRASKMSLYVDNKIDNIATGIIRSNDAEWIVDDRKNNEWTYIATFGKQSLNNDMQGLALFYRTKQLQKITQDDLNHVVVLIPENGIVEYYFMPAWELDVNPVKTKEQFVECIQEVLNRLNSKITCQIK